ncbi:MAG: DUF2589 domain-containing protein [Oscillospiraceae bacterium]|jgi:hypothetical protein|nr:DUF2589 domain-containing protein [Oscillospiraceae bacterium]
MKFWRKKDSGKKNEGGITLADIIRGLQYCVNSSRQMAMRQHIVEFAEFIDEDNKPHSRIIKINEQAAMEVPLICMINHNSLALDEMDVNMKLVVRNMDLKIPQENPEPSEANELDEIIAPEYLSRTSFSVDLDSAKVDRRNTRLKLNLKFKSGAPPEAVSRVIEKLNGQLMAYSLKKPDEESEE